MGSGQAGKEPEDGAQESIVHPHFVPDWSGTQPLGERHLESLQSQGGARGLSRDTEAKGQLCK